MTVYQDFFEGGAGEERTLRANVDAFERRRIIPRVLRGTGPRDLRTTLLGTDLSMPLLLAPTAFHLLAHPTGETGAAGAAAAAGIAMVVSMAATQPIEQIADTGATLWFQLYPQPDLDFQDRLLRRVTKAGVKAIVVTVDSPVFGHRTRDLANGFTDLPAGLTCANMDGRDIAMDDTLSWEHIDRLRAATGLPLVLKGILHPADAGLAVTHGADAVIVSNHGGRQLDGAIATLDALPAVLQAVGGRIPVLVDGGIRRGTDILVALALGAAATLVGRVGIRGLAGGPDGVREKIENLRAQLDHALALAGAQRPADLSPDQIS
ncbi:alpha-hydroxy acid oxidase [Actinoplanes sp. NPDC026619]|uniref:alpha-hydroxy acid oxidase n=1 Tax=Actinoplanes sp. NPDC026619 TaxID=3155798 RepID=UPI00340D2853